VLARKKWVERVKALGISGEIAEQSKADQGALPDAAKPRR
jgi:hypothetical protein